MSSLKTSEKRILESLFEMGGGYVLDFTNQEFQDFLWDTVKVDIYSDQYGFNGDSKAKRFRAFWQVESDEVVGEALSELLEIIEDPNPGIEKTSDYLKAKKIVNRLLKIQEKPVAEESSKSEEEVFLEFKTNVETIRKVNLEQSMLAVLENRLKEIEKCFKNEIHLSLIFQCGSTLEGVLLGVANRNIKEFNQAKSSPKNKDTGKVKPIYEWSLAQLIDVAFEVGLIQRDVKKFSHELRDFRNYIHPMQQVAQRFNPDMHTSKVCYQVLMMAIADLAGER